MAIPMNIKIGKYFTLAEMCASDTARARGIQNEPGIQETVNLTFLCTKILDPLREALRRPVAISSGYRSPALNRAVGGVVNSQHVTGQACDINIQGDTKRGQEVFGWIRDHCEFDQLIWEHNKQGVYWIHVSHSLNNNRRQVINNLLKR